MPSAGAKFLALRGCTEFKIVLTATIAIFATGGGPCANPLRPGKGDGCGPTRQLRLPLLRHGSPPAGPVDATRLRRLTDRRVRAVFIHGGTCVATTAAMHLFGPFSETAARGRRVDSDGPSSCRRSPGSGSRRPQYPRGGIGQCLRHLMFTPLEPDVNVRQ